MKLSTRTSLSTRTTMVGKIGLLLFIGFCSNNAVSAFQLPTKSQLYKSRPTITSNRRGLFSQSVNSTAVVDTLDLETFRRRQEDASSSEATPVNYNHNWRSRAEYESSFGPREVDRPNVHPIFKWKFMPEDVPLGVIAAMAVVCSPLLIPLLPVIVASRKQRWEELKETSKAEHQASFEENALAYRQSQRVLVDQLLEEQQQRGVSATQDLPQVIAVTMATGQEGQGVVRALSDAPQFSNTQILALVRNPTSRAAQALASLSPKITLVQCDSTDAASLRTALAPAQAVFLCTTLNRASAGFWEMNWNGAAQYQVQQGQAFAEACSGLDGIKQIVYGTAPLRKWPKSFIVEPPIHYAAKWRVEELLTNAKLPVTFLRKCPYHENFTKLTKATTKKTTAAASRVAAMGVEAGGAFDMSRKIELQPGTYKIKAMTPASFTYNMMDPRDTGKWAVLAFSQPNILVGQSLSVASDAMTGPKMAQVATDCGALGEGVTFEYQKQPRWLFEALAFVEPTFVYISGLQRWNIDGGVYDLDEDGVEHVRKLVPGSTWSDHLEREGLGQFTETMEDLLPDFTKRF